MFIHAPSTLTFKDLHFSDIFVFISCVILRLNNDYFPKKHQMSVFAGEALYFFVLGLNVQIFKLVLEDDIKMDLREVGWGNGLDRSGSG